MDIVPSGASINQPPLSAEQKRQLIEIHKKVNADPELPQLTTFAYIESEEMFGCGAGGVHHMFVDGEEENFGSAILFPLFLEI